MSLHDVWQLDLGGFSRFIERFVNSFEQPPREVTLDVDVFDAPPHGEQQLTFFHGYYKQYRYLVRAITCAENDAVVLPVRLNRASAPPDANPFDADRACVRRAGERTPWVN